MVADHGAAAFYLAVSAVAAAGLALVPAATRDRVAPVGKAAALDPISGRAVAALIAVFLFFTGMALVWAFLERIATLHGFGAAKVAAALSASAVANIAGSLLVATIGHRLPTRRAFALGAAMVGVCAAGLLARDDLVFAGAVCLLSLTWNFQFSFFFRCVATAPGGHRAGGLVPVATAAALTAGPAVGGFILARGGIAALDPVYVAMTLAALALAAATVRLSDIDHSAPSSGE